MAKKFLNFSELSPIIREEPWDLHFWESTPHELLKFIRSPREEARKIGIDIPDNIRIEVTVENLDWIAEKSNEFNNLKTESGDDIVICGTGNGGGSSTASIGKNYYRINFYGHLEKDLLKN